MLQTTHSRSETWFLHPAGPLGHRWAWSCSNTHLSTSLASLLYTMWDQPYSTTMGWLHCRLSFSLLRSSILCIRGARSSLSHAATSVSLPVDLVTSESRSHTRTNLFFLPLCTLPILIIFAFIIAERINARLIIRDLFS